MQIEAATFDHQLLILVWYSVHSTPYEYTFIRYGLQRSAATATATPDKHHQILVKPIHFPLPTLLVGLKYRGPRYRIVYGVRVGQIASSYKSDMSFRWVCGAWLVLVAPDAITSDIVAPMTDLLCTTYQVSLFVSLVCQRFVQSPCLPS